MIHYLWFVCFIYFYMISLFVHLVFIYLFICLFSITIAHNSGSKWPNFAAREKINFYDILLSKWSCVLVYVVFPGFFYSFIWLLVCLFLHFLSLKLGFFNWRWYYRQLSKSPDRLNYLRFWFSGVSARRVPLLSVFSTRRLLWWEGLATLQI